MRYRNVLTTDLPREEILKGTARSECLSDLRREITEYAGIVEEVIDGDQVTFTIEYEIAGEIEDLYDLAILVKTLERELDSMRYSGDAITLDKPSKVDSND